MTLTKDERKDIIYKNYLKTWNLAKKQFEEVTVHALEVCQKKCREIDGEDIKNFIWSETKQGRMVKVKEKERTDIIWEEYERKMKEINDKARIKAIGENK